MFFSGTRQVAKWSKIVQLEFFYNKILISYLNDESLFKKSQFCSVWGIQKRALGGPSRGPVPN
jgi:hypothetical protein